MSKKNDGTSLQISATNSFIDYATAFDSIDRKAPWRMMESDGVPEIIRLIKPFYQHILAQIDI